MREEENSTITEDIEYLEKAFKKWTPNMLSSPYIPTPSLLIKRDFNSHQVKKHKHTLTAKPSRRYTREKYKEIIDFLHKGAYAYSIGDYGTAINNFTRLLGIDWLKYSSYFYLVKTLIKLDIEKEILSLRTKSKTNNVRMTKTTETN